jgi:hypothetical protein
MVNVQDREQPSILEPSTDRKKAALLAADLSDHPTIACRSPRVGGRRGATPIVKPLCATVILPRTRRPKHDPKTFGRLFIEQRRRFEAIPDTPEVSGHASRSTTKQRRNTHVRTVQGELYQDKPLFVSREELTACHVAPKSAQPLRAAYTVIFKRQGRYSKRGGDLCRLSRRQRAGARCARPVSLASFRTTEKNAASTTIFPLAAQPPIPRGPKFLLTPRSKGRSALAVPPAMSKTLPGDRPHHAPLQGFGDHENVI